jgi:glutaryl-CoA dehydrogenase
MNRTAAPHAKAQFHWDDPLLLNNQLTDDERMVRDAAAAYCQDKLQPRVLEAFRHERMDTWARRFPRNTAAPA